MDDTLITKLIEDLENSDAASAADIADEVATSLARLLDDVREKQD